MNPIQKLQSRYLPNFYEYRYNSRKSLALSLKEKCLKNPNDLSLYELRITLKVLQQFRLLSKDPVLEKKQQQLKTKIVQKSIQSTIFCILPYGIREFHSLRSVYKFSFLALLFCASDAILMYPTFSDYISQCRRFAQENIIKLEESSQLNQSDQSQI